MKGFKMLFAETKRFYLVLALIAILFVILESVCAFESEGVVPFSSINAEKMADIDETLATQDAIAVFQVNSISFTGCFGGAFFDQIYAKIRYAIAVGFVMLLLFIKNYPYTDYRAVEFRNTWPIKNWVIELYDYLMILVTILFGYALEIVFLLVVQNEYNHRLMDIIGQYGDVLAIENIISASNKELVIGTVVLYVLPVIVMYTWLYLGMMIAKNPLVGVGIAFGMWQVLKIIWVISGFEWLESIGLGANSETEVYDSLADRISGVIFCVFEDMEIHYSYSDWYTSWMEGVSVGFWEDGIVNSWLFAKVILFILLLVGVVIVAKKRDLSKGKLLYFPVLDYPLSFLIGMFCFLFIVESWMEIGAGLAVIIGVVIAIVCCILIHPFRVKKSNCLEVK